jgi:general secretion pathway protein G
MRRRGFTLIELLVVMSIVALLASIAAPRYFRSMDRAKEVALRTSLLTMREAIDQYVADQGRYPESLQDLVDRRYLRALPEDPLTGSRHRWIEVPPAPDDALPGGMVDIRSDAPGISSEGDAYAAW